MYRFFERNERPAHAAIGYGQGPHALIPEPFEVRESGEIRGRVKNERIDDLFTLYYSKYDNYTIVWTKKKHES